MQKLYVVPVGSLELHFFDINMHFESLHWGKNKEWSWIYIGYEILTCYKIPDHPWVKCQNTTVWFLTVFPAPNYTVLLAWLV